MTGSIRRGSQRLQRLNAALDTSQAGSMCTATSMRLALTSTEYAAYRSELAVTVPQLKGRDAEALRNYKQALKRGDVLYARGMKLRHVGREAFKREPILWEAGRSYAHAFEIVLQLVSVNPLAAVLLDRPIDESDGCEPESIPRPLGSDSEYTRDDGGWLNRSIIAVQRETLRASALLLGGSTVTQQYAGPSPAPNQPTPLWLEF